jgi:hypothetical protein
MYRIKWFRQNQKYNHGVYLFDLGMEEQFSFKVTGAEYDSYIYSL